MASRRHPSAKDRMVMGQLLSVVGDKDDNRPGNLLGVFRRKVLGVFPGAFSGRFRGEVLGVFRRDVQGWCGFLWCGMVGMLHAFLVSDGHLKQEVFVLLECHICARTARSFFWSGENSGEFGAGSKCHCSAFFAVSRETIIVERAPEARQGLKL